MTVNVSVKRGDVPAINIVANLLSTSECNLKNGEVILVISNGDVESVNVRHSTPLPNLGDKPQ